METLELTRSDVKQAILTAAVVPTLCFMAGLASAHYLSDQQTRSQAEIQSVAEKPESTIALSSPPIPADVKAVEEDALNVAVALNEPKSEEILPINQKSYVVQAGVFSQFENAQLYQEKLDRQGIKSQIVNSPKNEKPLFRVILKSFEDQVSAETFADQTRRLHQLDVYVTGLIEFEDTRHIAALF